MKILDGWIVQNRVPVNEVGVDVNRAAEPAPQRDRRRMCRNRDGFAGICVIYDRARHGTTTDGGADPGIAESIRRAADVHADTVAAIAIGTMPSTPFDVAARDVFRLLSAEAQDEQYRGAEVRNDDVADRINDPRLVQSKHLFKHAVRHQKAAACVDRSDQHG